MTPRLSNKNRFISRLIELVPVSGLHRFFGIATMPDAISLRVGEPDFAILAPNRRSRFCRHLSKTNR
jgi:hypothetical protein